MKAGLFHEHGGPEVLRYEEIPTPQPGAGEVAVAVRACALNHLDLWVRRGLPGLKLELPHVGGSDVAGTVAELGPGVEGLSVGERVVIDPNLSCGHCRWCRAGEDSLCDAYGILGEHRRGGFAEVVVVPARNVLPLPEGIAFETAAAGILVSLTAWRMARRAGLRAGQTVLVIGAAGGVGSVALQIAKLAGARVLATAGGPEKCERVCSWGADEVIDHRAQDLSREAWERTDRRGVDVVLDAVGGAETLPLALRALSKDGTYVTCGATTGPQAELDVRLLFWKQLRVVGSTMSNRRELEEVLGLIWSGKLRPIVDRTLPLAELRRAHELLEARQVCGKLVLVP